MPFHCSTDTLKRVVGHVFDDANNFGHWTTNVHDGYWTVHPVAGTRTPHGMIGRALDSIGLLAEMDEHDQFMNVVTLFAFNGFEADRTYWRCMMDFLHQVQLAEDTAGVTWAEALARATRACILPEVL